MKGEVKTEPEPHLLTSRDGGERHCPGCSRPGARLWAETSRVMLDSGHVSVGVGERVAESLPAGIMGMKR